MTVVKRTLILIFWLLLLTSCASSGGLRNTPSNTAPKNLPPNKISMPSEIASTETSVTPDGTSVAIPSSTIIATEDTMISATTATHAACQLDPAMQPPWPDQTFTPNELDGETGLHTTGYPQPIDGATYRLQVTGLVDHPLSLSYDDIRCMPNVTDNPELICPGVFNDRATWTGVPIKYLLELAGVQEGASELTLVSADGYQVKLPLETASADGNFLAYKVNGETLPVLHGFPLRAVFPNMWGSYWLKWLVEIRIS
jgi:DMSO/TMAO reductase YedYZ molybdopterin-dependent catalytic subunit